MAREGHGNSLMANHSDDMVFITVMVDARSNITEATKNWATEFGLEHPALADEAGVTYPYVLLGLPTIVVIGRDMVIQNADLWPYDESFILDLL